MSFFLTVRRSARLGAALLLLGGAVPGSLLVSPSIVRAQEAMPLSGVILPKGSKRFTGADKNFTTLLTDVGKIDFVKRGAKGHAETWVWEGDAYKEDRGKFMRTAALRALTTAGYEVAEIDSSETGAVSLFTHFDLNDEQLAFRPELTKKDTYFIADNQAKKQTLIGVLLESKEALAISVMPLAFVGKVDTILPDVPSGAILVNGTDATTQVAVAKPPTFTKLAPKPRTVRGQVKDSEGKPLAGAEVAVYSSVGGGIRTTHTSRSNAQGMYEVLVPTGVGEVAQVEYTLTYNGEKFDIKLTPESGHKRQFDSKVGLVENYYIKTGGTSGGTLRVLHGQRKGMIEITLTPSGPLLSGGAGRPMIFRYDAGENGGEDYLHGVPLGRYSLTAQLLDGGDALPLRASRTIGGRKLVDRLAVNFEGGFEYDPKRVGKSNEAVRNFEVVLEP